MSTELAPNPSPADALIAALAKRGVTLRTDGVRIWPEPKASLHSDEASKVDTLHGELVAVLTRFQPGAECTWDANVSASPPRVEKGEGGVFTVSTSITPAQ